MNTKFINDQYCSKYFNDTVGGCAGMELYKVTDDKWVLVARLVFWDADNRFYFDPTTAELPLAILEEFITETKIAVQTGG